MSAKDEFEAAAEKAKGDVKETVGEALGDEELAAEGRADHAKGQLEDAAEKVKDAAEDAVEKAKDAASSAADKVRDIFRK